MNWKKTALGSIVINKDNIRKPLNKKERERISKLGMYPYIGANNIMGYIDEYLFNEKILCIAEDGGSWGRGQQCVKIYEGKTWVNNHAHVLVGTNKVHIEFLAYYLNYADLNRYITGTTRGKLTKTALNKIEIPLPSLEIQKRITYILDQADALRHKNDELLAYYDKLVQSVFLEMFGDPVINLKKWNKVRLKECTTKMGSGATPRGGKNAYKESGISLVRSMNIHDNFFKRKNLAFIDDIQADKLSNASLLKGDVLFNITGASVCRCAIVPDDILPARVNQHVCILRPKTSRMNSLFLTHCLISENSKKELLGVSKEGGATREAITKQTLQNYPIILPPIELQNKFANVAENIKSQKSKLKTGIQESENLFQCLLQKAFKGEL